MITYGMTAIYNQIKDIGMFVNILSYHKERGFDVITGENLKHTRRHFGNRTIVKCKVNSLTRTEHPVRVKTLPYIAQFYHASEEAPKIAASLSFSTEIDTGILPFHIGIRFSSKASRIGSMIQ